MLARTTVTALEDMFSDIEAFPKLMSGMNHWFNLMINPLNNFLFLTAEVFPATLKHFFKFLKLSFFSICKVDLSLSESFVDQF